MHHRLLAQGLSQKTSGANDVCRNSSVWWRVRHRSRGQCLIGIALVLVIFLGSIYVARRLGVITHSDAAGHPLPRPTIERSDSDETISFDREELEKL